MGFTQTPQTAPQNRRVNRQSSIPVSQSFSFATSSPATTSTGMSLRKRPRTFGVDEPYKKESHNHRKRAKIDHSAQDFGDELPEIALVAPHTATRKRRVEGEVTGDDLTPTPQRRRATSRPFALASPKTEEPEVTDNFPAEVALPAVDSSCLSRPTYISEPIAGPEEDASGEQLAQATTYPDISIGAVSPEVRDPRGAIGDTTEWKLIYGLRQSSHRFVDRQGLARRLDAVGVGSTRTLELRTALCDLNIQIHTTFTILRLELLLHLESELEDDASQPSSESGSDDESDWFSANSDPDDASSQSSALSERSFDISDHSPSPSCEQALSLLRDLCSHLEARVNPRLVIPGDSDQASAYPRLTRLIGYVQSPRSPTERLEFIPTPGSNSGPTSFLFNVTENVETMDAFITLYDLAQKKIPREPREQMLLEVGRMRDCFSNLNRFFGNLQMSIGSLDNLATRPSQTSTAAGPFSSFALLQKFRQQTAAACRAIFSQFGSCAHRTTHKILLELPGWEDVSDYHSTEATLNLPVQLFFTSCPETYWQPASVYFLQSERINVCGTPSLCKALNDAYNDGRDLQFCVSENSERSHPGKIPIHTFYEPKSDQRYGNSFPNDSDSLWTLIKQGYFTKDYSLDRLCTHDNGDVLGIDQRKALAVKLVLGLMLSMDSDHILDTWDPKRIHFLKPVDTALPFVSIYGYSDTSSRRDSLSLAKLDVSGDDDDDDWKSRRPFALLAKALLQIAHGARLKPLQFSYSSKPTFYAAWKQLRRMVEHCLRRVTQDVVDLELLPFLRAAQNCLDFHTRYQARRRVAQSNHRMEIAWHLILEGILTNFDLKGKSVQPGTDALTKEGPVPVAGHTVIGESPPVTVVSLIPTPSVTAVAMRSRSIGTIATQPEVALFDGEDVAANSTETRNADIFFKMLDEFHGSYSRFVTDRATNSGGESPRRIRIAVLDTGIDFRHPGIMDAKHKGRMKKEWCHSWVGAETDVEDEDDGLHGTNCAYILHKVAPEADIYVEKVFQRNSFRTYQAENIAWAINHAVKTWDVDIISMSFGLRPPVPRTDGNQDQERLDLQNFGNLVERIEDAIRIASAQSSCIMFAAASNNGKNEQRAFPARYDPWVICVHASDGKGTDGGINPPTKSGPNFMTLGMGLELMERERKEGEPTPKYKMVYRSGTSFATPIAAGIAATVLDLAARVSAIGPTARRKLKVPQEMERMLRLMSSPQHGFGHEYRFLAPWNHWKRSWEANVTQVVRAWGKINELFDP